MLLPLLGGLIGGAVSAGTSYLNYTNQDRNRKQQLALQEETWNREDNAVQRRVADLEAAGLSKTLAAGSAAGTSSPINVTAPQFEANPVQDAISNAQIAMSLMKQKEDISKTQAETENIRAQKFKTFQEGKFLEETFGTRVNTVVKSLAKMNSEDQLLKMQRQLTEAKKNLTGEQLNEVQSQIELLEEALQLKKYDVEVAERDAQVRRDTDVPVPFTGGQSINPLDVMRGLRKSIFK